MAALSDHDRRDAEDVLRTTIMLLVKRHIRRSYEQGKALIKEDLDEHARLGKPVDGPAIGLAAAEKVIERYFGVETLDAYTQPAIEAQADPADGFA